MFQFRFEIPVVIRYLEMMEELFKYCLGTVGLRYTIGNDFFFPLFRYFRSFFSLWKLSILFFHVIENFRLFIDIGSISG